MDEGLWRDLTALYDEPGVSSACLRAQDEGGADVVLVLLAALLARRGRRLGVADGEALAARVAPWQREVVKPLRELRRRWRGIDGASTLRETLKAVELDAERRQLALLAPLLSSLAPAPRAPELLAGNLGAVLPSTARERHLPLLLDVLGGGGDGTPSDSTMRDS